MSQTLMYDDDKHIPINKMASVILFTKMMFTLPFNVIGLVLPEILFDYPWILFIEAFHHYHARIFYLLAVHRNITQFYFTFWGNGLIQKRFLQLELMFDLGLVTLYIHEYFRLHNIHVFFSPFILLHFGIAMISTYSVYIASYHKTKPV